MSCGNRDRRGRTDAWQSREMNDPICVGIGVGVGVGLLGELMAANMDDQLRECLEEGGGQQSGAIVIGNDRRQLALCKQGKDSLGRLSDTDGDVGCATPACTQHSHAGVSVSRGQNAHPHRRLRLEILSQASSQSCAALRKYTVA